jgi:hypothetical protein
MNIPVLFAILVFILAGFLIFFLCKSLMKIASGSDKVNKNINNFRNNNDFLMVVYSKEDISEDELEAGKWLAINSEKTLFIKNKSTEKKE